MTPDVEKIPTMLGFWRRVIKHYCDAKQEPQKRCPASSNPIEMRLLPKRQIQARLTKLPSSRDPAWQRRTERSEFYTVKGKSERIPLGPIVYSGRGFTWRWHTCARVSSPARRRYRRKALKGAVLGSQAFASVKRKLSGRYGKLGRPATLLFWSSLGEHGVEREKRKKKKTRPVHKQYVLCL